MIILGPELQRSSECEAVIRTLPRWFGIEESLLMYANDTAQLPTFAIERKAKIIGLSHCYSIFQSPGRCAVLPSRPRRVTRGYGRALIAQAERWLVERGAKFLKIKSIAATSPSAEYAETRKFYAACGYVPLEVFPALWSPRNPALQFVKALNAA